MNKIFRESVALILSMLTEWRGYRHDVRAVLLGARAFGFMALSIPMRLTAVLVLLAALPFVWLCSLLKDD